MPTKKKARAAGLIFDGLCELMGDEGTRVKRALASAHEALGEEGREALASGDVVGAGLEALRNVRRKGKPPASTSLVEVVDVEDEKNTDDDDMDAFE